MELQRDGDAVLMSIAWSRGPGTCHTTHLQHFQGRKRPAAQPTLQGAALDLLLDSGPEIAFAFELVVGEPGGWDAKQVGARGYASGRQGVQAAAELGVPHVRVRHLTGVAEPLLQQAGQEAPADGWVVPWG